MESPESTPTDPPVAPMFFYDLASPLAYVVAEQVNGRFSELGAPVPEWRPILGSGLVGGDAALAPGRLAATRDQAERAVSAYGLPPLRWPQPWPADTTEAMAAATFAKQIGRSVAFSLAAFRQAFAAGRDLGVLDNVLIAGAACELHPRALSSAVGRDSVRAELESATAEAVARGVEELPSIVVGNRVFPGIDGIEAAAQAALVGI